MICCISVLCILCNETDTDADDHCIESSAGDTRVSFNSAQQSSGLSESHYFIRHYGYLDYACSVYGIKGISSHEYFVPVLLVEIPDHKEKEERINRMLLERYVAVLPDDMDKQWWEQQELHIMYRSDRYLCFRYLSNSELPEGCNIRDLYFTLDMENESIIDYPMIEGETGKYEPYRFGSLYKELECYQEKPVEEQSLLRRDGQYQMHQVTAECDGIFFPCVEVEGIADKKKQEEINMALQEPMRSFIKNGIWENSEEEQKLMNNIRIYAAYQTEQWLSVVYSIEVTDYPDFKRYDGIKDLGITINMQSGKRVLLDDLFEQDKILNWFYVMGMYKEGDKNNGGLGLLFQTEEEKIKEYKQVHKDVKITEVSWLWDTLYWNSFYLYKGKLMILRTSGSADFEIPLPEICEYLRVDPWYD